MQLEEEEQKIRNEEQFKLNIQNNELGYNRNEVQKQFNNEDLKFEQNLIQKELSREEYFQRELNNSKTQSVVNDMILSILADEEDQTEDFQNKFSNKIRFSIKSKDNSFFRNSDAIRNDSNSFQNYGNQDSDCMSEPKKNLYLQKQKSLSQERLKDLTQLTLKKNIEYCGNHMQQKAGLLSFKNFNQINNSQLQNDSDSSLIFQDCIEDTKSLNLFYLEKNKISSNDKESDQSQNFQVVLEQKFNDEEIQKECFLGTNIQNILNERKQQNIFIQKNEQNKSFYINNINGSDSYIFNGQQYLQKQINQTDNYSKISNLSSVKNNYQGQSSHSFSNDVINKLNINDSIDSPNLKINQKELKIGTSNTNSQYILMDYQIEKENGSEELMNQRYGRKQSQMVIGFTNMPLLKIDLMHIEELDFKKMIKNQKIYQLEDQVCIQDQEFDEQEIQQTAYTNQQSGQSLMNKDDSRHIYKNEEIFIENKDFKQDFTEDKEYESAQDQISKRMNDEFDYKSCIQENQCFLMLNRDPNFLLRQHQLQKQLIFDHHEKINKVLPVVNQNNNDINENKIALKIDDQIQNNEITLQQQYDQHPTILQIDDNYKDKNTEQNQIDCQIQQQQKNEEKKKEEILQKKQVDEKYINK